MKYNELSEEERKILIDKGTEPPFRGKYTDIFSEGIYVCKQCNAPLFKSEAKFHSGCGWPSFDRQIEGAVRMQPDADGRRTEIVCARCGGHLGHVFFGEGFTEQNTRHCVNSLSLIFHESESETIDTAYFAAGCFWGVEYYFKKAPGVLAVASGYMGGTKTEPTYEEVCTGKTGHAETVRVLYDSAKQSYEDLVRLFFEIHDFTQIDGQGPDIGNQYRSVIFYDNEQQQVIAEKYVLILQNKNYTVATSVEKAQQFWIAEGYHQDYYFKKGSTPYCHFRRAIF